MINRWTDAMDIYFSMLGYGNIIYGKHCMELTQAMIRNKQCDGGKEDGSDNIRRIQDKNTVN